MLALSIRVAARSSRAPEIPIAIPVEWERYSERCDTVSGGKGKAIIAAVEEAGFDVAFQV